uniref:Lipocalin/cytosolic fatty-acid binding domain-containing protein n=1 Tax=Branchiostoma floridae TaxID=7739 RepID=C3YII0_BRAFL|eukprot:XP_002603902.1 hypothetical protein BRAFLDRAFT_102260 [Branchiostoma floridae]
MPFDLERGTGTWKLSKYSDNFGEIMVKLGVPAEYMDTFKAIEVCIECTVSGNTFTDKVTMMGKTTINTYTLGEECEETDHTGTKRKVTYTMDGDTLAHVYPNHDGKGLVVRQTLRWIDDKTLHRTYNVGDLEGWSEGQKV